MRLIVQRMCVVILAMALASCAKQPEAAESKMAETSPQTKMQKTQTKVSASNKHDPYYLVYGYKEGGRERKWRQLEGHINVIEGETEDPKYVKELREKGITFAARRRLTKPFVRDGSLEEVIAFLAEPFKNTFDGELEGGFDAIAIDEVNQYVENGSELGAKFIQALTELRRRYPNKTIFIAATYQIGKNAAKMRDGKFVYSDFLDFVVDQNMVLLLELYNSEKHPRPETFSQYALQLKRSNKAILKNTIFLVTIYQQGRFNADNSTDVQFTDFVQGQLDAINECEACAEMPGVGFWALYAATMETTNAIPKLLSRFKEDRE